MTLPNKLTLSRYCLTPVFALLFCIMKSGAQHSVRIASAVACLLICAYMEITDLLDGIIARKRGLVTDLGKVFDPFSDSVMHLTFFALFVRFGMIGFIAFYLIMFREFSILFIRLLLVKTGKVLPANMLGKFKTVFYAVLSLLAILYSAASAFEPFPPELDRLAVQAFHVLSYFAAFFSVLSFAVYFFSGIVKGKALSQLTK